MGKSRARLKLNKLLMVMMKPVAKTRYGRAIGLVYGVDGLDQLCLASRFCCIWQQHRKPTYLVDLGIRPTLRFQLQIALSAL